MELERTELAQQQFIGLTAEQHQRNQVADLTRLVMQQIVAESPYAPDMEWALWDRARVLEDENMLPHGVTAFEVHQYYLRVYEAE